MTQTSETSVGISFGAATHETWRHLLIRFCFGAAISAVAGVLSLAVGLKFGGIFLAFPAILPATLTLVEKEEMHRRAEALDVGAVMGASALVAFAFVAWWLLGNAGAPVAIVVAGAAWLLAAVALYLISSKRASRGS